MVLISILKERDLKEPQTNKSNSFIRNVPYDLNTIKEDLKELEYIYNNLDDYKEERLLSYFMADKEHYSNCIKQYKKIDGIVTNGEYFLINEDFLKYSVKCRDLLTKIIRELKKMHT